MGRIAPPAVGQTLGQTASFRQTAPETWCQSRVCSVSRPASPKAWFLWVLLALDALAAAIWWMAPRALEALGRPIYALRYRPAAAFAAFLMFSIIIYLPMHLMF